MPYYEVDVRKTTYLFSTILVEADNASRAGPKALAIARNFEFSERKSPDYLVYGVHERKDLDEAKTHSTG